MLNFFSKIYSTWYFVEVILGSEFRQLKKLTQIIFGRGKYDCSIINQGMFDILQNNSLHFIDMSSIGIDRISGKCRLHYLEKLELSNSPYLKRVSMFIFHWDFFPRLKHISLQITSMVMDGFERLSQQMRGIPLNTWEIDRNNIKEIYPGIHDTMPKLETFSATHNQLLSTTDLTAELLTLRHLKYLYLSRQNNMMYYEQIKPRHYFNH